MGYAPIILAIVLTAVHYIIEAYVGKYEAKHKSVISLAIGMFLTFIFLELMPRLFAQAGNDLLLYLFVMMWGFIIFHIIEKHIYKHVKKYSQRYKDINELDIAAFFVDNVLIGIVIVVIFTTETIGAVALLSIPFIMHTVSSALSLNKIYSRVRIKNWTKLVVRVSVLIGALIASIFPVSRMIYLFLLAFIIGGLLFTIARDMLPKYKKGNPTFFILGNIVAVVIIFLTYLI